MEQCIKDLERGQRLESLAEQERFGREQAEQERAQLRAEFEEELECEEERQEHQNLLEKERFRSVLELERFTARQKEWRIKDLERGKRELERLVEEERSGQERAKKECAQLESEQRALQDLAEAQRACTLLELEFEEERSALQLWAEEETLWREQCEKDQWQLWRKLQRKQQKLWRHADENVRLKEAAKKHSQNKSELEEDLEELQGLLLKECFRFEKSEAERNLLKLELEEQRLEFGEERSVREQAQEGRAQLALEFEEERKELEGLVEEERRARDHAEEECEELEWELENAEEERNVALEELGQNKANEEEHIEKLCQCSEYEAAEQAFSTLEIDARLLSRQHDRCYCRKCYRDSWSSVIRNDGPKEYVVPRGWVRFGLQVPVHADVHDVWRKWCVSFHGTKHEVAKSIVSSGEFLMPGDKLPDGSILGSVNCAGRTDKMTYTSPTVNYAGLAFYANPGPGQRGTQFQVVLQCRQKPDTFRIQGETMGFKGSARKNLCPHVGCNEIEWVSDARKTIIPYGILIRVFRTGHPPERYYRSPVDRGRF